MKTSEIKKILIEGNKLSFPKMKNDYIFLKGKTVYLASTGLPCNVGSFSFKWKL